MDDNGEWIEDEGAPEYFRRTSTGVYDESITVAKELVSELVAIDTIDNTSLDDDPSYSTFRLWAHGYRSSHGPSNDWQDPIATSQDVLKTLEDAAKKLEAAEKEDGMSAFLGARDPNPWPWYQRPIDTKPTKNLMKDTPSMVRKRIKPRAASTIAEIFEQRGDYCHVKPIENIPSIAKPDLDICEILDMKPMLDPAEAQAVAKLLKYRVSRNKALRKEGDLHEDPIWDQWTAEDKSRMKKPTQRLPLPVFPLPHFASRPHATKSYKGVSHTVFHAVPYLCQNIKRDFIPRSLGPDVLGNDVDPTAIEVLDDMDEQIIHHPPPMRTTRQPISPIKDEQPPPMMSMPQMIEIERQRNPQWQDGRYRPEPRNRLQAPRPAGVYDTSALGYQDFLAEDAIREPVIERIRGVTRLLEQLDWESFYIEGPELYETGMTVTDTSEHIARYGTREQPTPQRTRAPTSLSATHPFSVDGESRSLALSPNREVRDTLQKRRYDDTLSREESAEAEPEKRIRIAPALDMNDLRKIVTVSEAKVDYNKVRTIEPMVSSRELTDFLKDVNPAQTPAVAGSKGRIGHKTNKGQGIKRKASLSEIVGSQGGIGKKAQRPHSADGWRKHPSIQNPSWYGQNIRLAASDTMKAAPRGTPIPIFIASSVLRNRPIYRAIENVNFDSVEGDTSHIQYVDIVLTPSTGIIFHPLNKLPTTDTALLKRVKAAAVYFQRTIIVFEVIPYRLLAVQKDASKGTDMEDPLSAKVLHALASFRRAIAIQLEEKKEDMMGTAEVVFATKGAEEVSNMLKGVAITFNNDMSKTLKGTTLDLWKGRKWVHQDMDPEEEVTLVEAGFNLFSTHFILGARGSFTSFAEDMTPPERLKLVGPVVGKQAVNRFNAKWWRRQAEIRKIQSSLPSSDTVASPLAGR